MCCVLRLTLAIALQDTLPKSQNICPKEDTRMLLCSRAGIHVSDDIGDG